MSHILPLQVDLDEEVIRAVIQTSGSEGASLDDIKGYLSSALNEMPALKSIQSSLNNAVDKGLLSQLDGGRYKIKETAENVEEDAHCTNILKIEHLKKLINEEKENKKAAKNAEEAIEDVDSVSKELFSKLTIGQDKIRKTSERVEKTTKVANNASKELLSMSIFTKDKTGEMPKSEEDALGVKNISKEFLSNKANEEDKANIIVKQEEVLQDTNRYTDPSTPNVIRAGNLGSPAAKDDVNVSISDMYDKNGIEKE